MHYGTYRVEIGGLGVDRSAHTRRFMGTPRTPTFRATTINTTVVLQMSDGVYGSMYVCMYVCVINKNKQIARKSAQFNARGKIYVADTLPG